MQTSLIEINFASKNPHKIAEATGVLRNFGIKVNPISSKVREIQASSLKDVAADSARTTADKIGRNVVVEDAGLFIDWLKGFPGPYSSYTHQTIGCKGILRLLKDISKRSALFRSAVSYCEPNREPKVFIGEIRGKISISERSGIQFGFDPIFVPNGSTRKAFSEMSLEQKNSISHRSQAFTKFAVWFLKER
ncbi:MAG: RdgB/HAM1 family non-canonical purine NTP pyrophosphatase [Candidatus Atabeyarchaeum deiterrae]|jgi:XTP/dITP diphosphohydrolase